MIRLFLTYMRGLRDMGRHPLANLFSLLTVATVVLLAGVFLMFLNNVNKELIKSRGQVEFQVYWQPGTSQAHVEKQWKRLGTITGLKSMETFTPDQALEELGRTLNRTTDKPAGQPPNTPADFAWMRGDNPLPASAYLAFGLRPGEDGGIWASGLLKELQGLPGVERVHYNPFQMDLAHSWITLVHGLIWPVIGVLGLIIALVVGNTMRLSLLTRGDEIEILSLVGAKPWYIRGPLLMAGMTQGLLGSALALGALKLVQLRLADTLNFPPLYLKIEFLPCEHWAALMGVATLVAMLSSFVAVRK